MPIKYIGRTTNFKGKSLWEILGNLKDFGVGRIVVRSVFERYPQPTFNKIMKVEALPHEVRIKKQKCSYFYIFFIVGKSQDYSLGGTNVPRTKISRSSKNVFDKL